MIEVVTEFVVKETSRGWFELTYGPGGAWGQVFDGCEGFHGTTVLRDEEDPRRYLTIELWASKAARAEREKAYVALLADFDAWIDSMREMGVFRVLAQATVRPRGAGRRGR